MPKYVFEVSGKLPAGEALEVRELIAISMALAAYARELSGALGHRLGDVIYSPPFEHVGGDWLPPDENGSIKMGASRPIDLDPANVDYIGPEPPDNA